MAQLRDSKTSALIAEGTPLEVALVGRELGYTAVVVRAGEKLPKQADAIYDDVGEGFDPDAVLKAHEENLDGLAAAAKDQKLDRATQDSLQGALKAAKAEADVTELAQDAAARRDEARARL